MFSWVAHTNEKVAADCAVYCAGPAHTGYCENLLLEAVSSAQTPSFGQYVGASLYWTTCIFNITTLSCGIRGHVTADKVRCALRAPEWMNKASHYMRWKHNKLLRFGFHCKLATRGIIYHKGINIWRFFIVAQYWIEIPAVKLSTDSHICFIHRSFTLSIKML